MLRCIDCFAHDLSQINMLRVGRNIGTSKCFFIIIRDFSLLVVSADGSCNAVDYVDPRRFRREDGESCETEKLTDHCGKSQSTSVPQTVSKLHLLSFCLYSTMLASCDDAAWIIL